MVAIELGLPTAIPDLCASGANAQCCADPDLSVHHSTSQLTVPLAQTRVSQERPRHLGLDARIQCLMRLAWRLGGGPERLPCPARDWATLNGAPGSGSRAQTRWMACGPGSGQRAQRHTRRRHASRREVPGGDLGGGGSPTSGSSDVAELKGERSGEGGKGSRWAG